MADHHEPKMGTKTKQKESILTFRMCVIIENSLRFMKRYAVFSAVLFSLSGLPIKSNFCHIYIVFTFKN